MLFLVLVSYCSHIVAAAMDEEHLYTNEWAVQFTHMTTDEEANYLAEKNGFVNFGRIGNIENMYRYVYNDRKGMNSKFVHNSIANNLKVIKADRQLKRVRVKKNSFCIPTDPKWGNQWSLKNTGQTTGPANLDLNVEKAWLQNITGAGVLVGVVDDGVEWSHPDIQNNYEPSASHDFAHNDNDPMPDPPKASGEPNSHGTSCAGEIAMRNNCDCGIGVAYNSRIAALKINLDLGTDAEEASAIGHMTNNIMIYSNSWGPDDKGFTVGGPGQLTSLSFTKNAAQGRDGKGSIYVWASGNGGFYRDSCAADGYVNSIYTIAVGSANQNGYQASYDENCTAKIAVTYSYNSDTFPGPGDKWNAYNQITTLDLNNRCTDSFTGTSASAPLVSATIALTLESNPDLTWRDIQYLIVYTSDTTRLIGEWYTNGAGLKVSSQFGFGAIDAEAMVTRARNWINVPPQLHSSISVEIDSGSASLLSNFETSFGVLLSTTDIRYLEHVVVTMSLTIIRGVYEQEHDYMDFYEHYVVDKSECILYDDLKNVDDTITFYNDYPWLTNENRSRRGDISIKLISPDKTESILLPSRKFDFINAEGYFKWPFMSMHHWAENPVGQWTISIIYNNSHGYVGIKIESVDFYGTSEMPQAVQQIPKKCDSVCTRGCAADGPLYCDSCVELRDIPTMECVSGCFDNSSEYNHYCVHIGSVITCKTDHRLLTILISSIAGGGVCIIIMFIIILAISCIVSMRYRSHCKKKYQVLSVVAEDV